MNISITSIIYLCRCSCYIIIISYLNIWCSTFIFITITTVNSSEKNKIIILDFGSVRTFSREFVCDYIRLLESVEKRDLSEYKKCLLQFGFFGEDDPPDLFEEHLEMVHELLMPYLRQGKNSVPQSNPMEMVKGFVDKIDLRGRKSPNEEFLLLDRAHLGLYTKIKAWRSTIDWTSSMKRYWHNLSKSLEWLISGFFLFLRLKITDNLP